MAKDADGIRVTIYDQEYYVRGDLDEAYIHRLAQFLDARMRAIAVRSHTVDSLRVAVLAALNIADEYHQMMTQYEETSRRVDQKIEEWTRILDRALDEAV